MNMTYQRALQVYGLTTLIGETESSLKKKKRKLIKLNHPDSKRQTNVRIDDVVDAYEILITNLNGHSTGSGRGPMIYTGFYKQKDKKILNYQEYLEAIDLGNRKIEDLNIEYLLYLSCKFRFRHLHKGECVGESIHIYEVKYERNDTYPIDLELDFELGDSLEIDWENGEKVLRVGLNLVSNMAMLSIKPTLVDSLNFVVNILQKQD